MTELERAIKRAKTSEWYQPFFDRLEIQSFNFSIEMKLRLKAFDSPDSLKLILGDLEEKLGKYLVFVSCPNCGLRVPAMELTVNNKCLFCERKEEG